MISRITRCIYIITLCDINLEFIFINVSYWFDDNTLTSTLHPKPRKKYLREKFIPLELEPVQFKPVTIDSFSTPLSPNWSVHFTDWLLKQAVGDSADLRMCIKYLFLQLDFPRAASLVRSCKNWNHDLQKTTSVDSFPSNLLLGCQSRFTRIEKM